MSQSFAVQHYDVVMYGDTLIEAWRGTILGEPSLRVQGCSEIFHSHFGQKYSTGVYGIAGEPAVWSPMSRIEDELERIRNTAHTAEALESIFL